MGLLKQWAGIELVHVVGETFHGKTVFLDGRHFEKCVFTDCAIMIRAARFGLTDCSIDGCTFHYDGPAEAIALLIAEGAPKPPRQA